MKYRIIQILLTLIVSLVFVKPVLEAKKKKGKLSYALLGPTGILGTKGLGKSEITVDKAEPGSPADGKLKKDDVIVAINGNPVSRNPGEFREQLTQAVMAAESTDGKMVLKLSDKREVVLKLSALGSYSPTAPYNCPKTEKIITGAADALVKRLSKAKKGGSATQVELLGLMATGEKKYIDVVGEVLRKQFSSITYDGKSLQARSREQFKKTGRGSAAVGSWVTAYATIAMAEYYYLTKDKAIFPALKTYTLSLVEGQDPAGLYGHKMVNPATNRAPGYGQMNQPSLAALLGMLLAKKCGVDVPGLDEAIGRTQSYVEYHINKGGFPYGFHGPREFDFNNNGTSGLAAVCMALAGNKEGASFFSAMSATSEENLGVGHASSLFSTYWTPAGANVAGPKVTQKFFPEIIKYLTPRRKWDGSFVQQYNEGPMGGVALLAHCLPRKALLITGKEADDSIWLDEKEADATVNMSKITEGKTPDELLFLFKHKNPVVRYNAVNAIKTGLGLDRKSLKILNSAKTRKGKKKAAKLQKSISTFTKLYEQSFPKIEEMISSGTDLEKICALRCYFFLCPESEIKKRIETAAGILRNTKEPDELRVEAIKALAKKPEDGKKYYQDILKFLLEPRPDDRYAEIDSQIAEYAIDPINKSVQWNPYAAGLVKDKDLFYKASIRLMKHKRQNFRGTGVRMLTNVPEEDLPIVINELEHILKDDDRTYHSYHNPTNAMAPAANIFVKHNILEGVEYIGDVILNSPGKFGMKIRMLTQTLSKYGGNAKPIIPELMENKWIKVMYDQDRMAREQGKAGHPHMAAFKAMVEKIENDPNPPKLISVEEVKKRKK